jgi:hypothetical protein
MVSVESSMPKKTESNTVIDDTFASKQRLSGVMPGQRRPSTARANAFPGNLATTRSQFTPKPAPPAPPRNWHSLATRTRPKTSLSRISTDFILAQQFVNDINEMLDYIRNWDREDAKEIMKSFENDLVNEGREITFAIKNAVDNTKHWCVDIKNPNRSIFHPEEYEKSHLPPVGQRPIRIDRGIHSNGGLPPACWDGCDEGCPRELTKEDKDGILKRGRLLWQMEKSAQDVRAEMQKSKFGLEKELNKRQDSAVRHWLDTGDTSTHEDPNVSTTEKAEPPKVLLTPAEWEKLDALDSRAPPPTPRLKHMKLPASQWGKLDPIRQPPPTPQPGYMDFSEWDNTTPVEPPRNPRPSVEDLSHIVGKEERDKLLMPPPPPPRPKARAPLPLVQTKKDTTP